MRLSSPVRPRSEEADAHVVHPWISSRTRRALDVCCAALALAACFPFFLIIAIAVRCTSRGPILFRQRRMGRNGRAFTLLKFRSMVVTREPGALITVSGDRRITAVGAFLRHYKLDELPQFWNILRGDMALVGPRPKLPQHEALMLCARPGITGPATLLFRNEERLLARFPADQVEIIYNHSIKPEKALLDAAYLREATFVSDCRMVIATITACLRPEACARILREHLDRTSLSWEQTSASYTLAPIAAVQHPGAPTRSETRRRGAIVWQASALLFLLLTPVIARAQQTLKPSAGFSPDSRFDVFAGYSFWGTEGSVGNSPFLGSDQGINVNASWYFRRYLGAQIDGKYFYNEFNDSLTSVSAGPVFRIPASHGFTPFLHVLIGAADINGPPGALYPGLGRTPAAWGPQFTAGEGLDYELPWLHHRFAVRIGQADYMYNHIRYKSYEASSLNSVTLSTGLVMHFGNGAARARPR